MGFVPNKKNWFIQKQQNTEFIHFIPIGDVKLHKLDPSCDCNPDFEMNGNADSIFIHTSYDGREWKELLNKKNYNV